ncbi:carcinoembryonic antigen-related cell adhesion molecule 1 [Parambassis ranga]|uniref:Carcinoembryonic antigen-related cell adhesion molecule 1 n=1 Tax=Parambassis ranga TaxID=210632 RepID=A0A6P7JW03_9TELE|nr:carcinoembryonic antigen-related cell adhesion molecule 5-like [Parambassis ranga]
MPTITGPKVAYIGDNVTLSCYAKSKPASYYRWYFKACPVSNESEYFLRPLTANMSGMYTCIAFNNITSKNSTAYTFLRVIHDGPEMPTITGPKVAYIGDNVTLSCYAKSKPASYYRWYFKACPVSNESEYVLRPLTANMSGMYTCIAFNNITSKNSTAYTFLRVIHDPLTAVTVNILGPAILDEPLTLLCEATGSVDSIQWWKNGQLMSANNTAVFKMNNKTLTLNPVQYSDSGYYQCQAFNSLSNLTSDSCEVVVYYGPEMPTITGPKVAYIGDNVTLSCYAKSNPASYYRWYFKACPVSNESEYVLRPLTANMSGMYTCIAFNNITSKNSTAYTFLRVIHESIQNVQIKAPMTPAIEGHPYNLACVICGHADYVYWMKNDKILHEDYRVTFGIDNKTINFHSVDREDSDFYRCKAVNAVGSMTSQRRLLIVSYGPKSVDIFGPHSANGSSLVSLTCSADAWPKCNFTWFLNDQLIRLKNGAVLTFSATKQNEGNYTCEVWNPVTSITMYQTKTFTVASRASAILFQSQAGLMLMGLLVLSVPVVLN